MWDEARRSEQAEDGIIRFQCAACHVQCGTRRGGPNKQKTESKVERDETHLGVEPLDRLAEILEHLDLKAEDENMDMNMNDESGG